MKKYKWWIYTVALGLVPFFMRWLIYSFATTKLPDLYILNEIDMVAFGLVMATSNISEIDADNRFSEDLKGLFRGVSLVILLLMAAVLGIAYLVDAFEIKVIDRTKIKYASLMFSSLSFILSLGIVYKPSFLIRDG